MSIEEIFKKLEAERIKKASQKIEYIVAGLGNPGREYEKTRHNAGFMALDFIADKLGVEITKGRFYSLTAEGEIGGKRVLFMKPQTYMNESGKAVGEAAKFYKIPPERVVILFDDISLPTGKLRIRKSGSAGGHNGIKSIIAHLGSENFPRLKCGVGEKPSPELNLADWVLSRFSKEDVTKLNSTFERAYSALGLVVNDKFDDAMCKYNG